MNVVFAGGGTGGHLYPAIAIAEELRDSGASIDFVGTAERLEATIVPKAGYRLHAVKSAPLNRRPSLALFWTVAANLRGICQSFGILGRLKPDIIIATGGYVCFPVVVAARLLRIVRRIDAPIVLLEPNAQPGLTNRLLAPLVDEVWGAFGRADARFAGKYVYTGIPVRSALRALPTREEALARFGLSTVRQTLLAMGGSQGARSINDALTALIKSNGVPPGWQLIHITGEREYDRVRRSLGSDEPVLRPYVDDLSDAYAAADLVLARAGASTLGELVATGKPAILVPYPHASDDHQARNAAAIAESGAAVVIDDRELAAGKLRGILAEATSGPALRALRAAAQTLRATDPVATILARIAALTARKTRR